MKTLIGCIIIFTNINAVAQLHSGTPAVQSKAQPVPNASTNEKSAPPQRINIPTAANPVPPVYLGAEVRAVIIPRQLINPPTTASGTQPVQKEPLSPVESTNALQPNRPQREEVSRTNPPVSLPVTPPNSSNYNSKNQYSLGGPTKIPYKKSVSKTTKKRLPIKSVAGKKVAANKKPR